MDARRTADDTLVARHDPVLADGRIISELTRDQTDAAGVMRISELFDALPSHVGVNVEVKTALEDALRTRSRTTAALVTDLVSTLTSSRRLLVTSFDPAALVIVRERAPRLPVGLLTWIGFPLRKAIAAAAHLGVDVVGPHIGSFGLDGSPPERPPREAVQVAHAAGLQVIAWCPDAEQSRQLADVGVDCLIVDDPWIRLDAPDR